MNTLTERYVYAAVRTVPQDQRAELDPSIRELVGDTIEAKLASGVPADEAEREALVSLGDPELLAASYSDRPLQLIGPRYYLAWWRLLRTLLVTVVPIVAVVIAAIELLDGSRSLGASIGPAIGHAIGVGLEVGVQLCFWVTLVFAILDRSGRLTGATDSAVGAAGQYVNVTMPWTPEQLPPMPSAAGTGPARLELGSNIAFAGVWAAALIWQAVSSPVRNAAGERLPVIHPDPWPLWLSFFLALTAAEIGFWIVLHRRGGWSWPFAGLNALLNLAFAVPAIVLLLGGDMLGQAFFTELGWPEGTDAVARIASVVIAVVAIWDTVDGALRTRRATQLTRPTA